MKRTLTMLITLVLAVCMASMAAHAQACPEPVGYPISKNLSETSNHTTIEYMAGYQEQIDANLYALLCANNMTPKIR